nr:hypothetical protein [Anaerolineae bacterium]
RTMVGLPPALFSHVRQLARDLPPARGRRIMVGLPPHLQRLLSVLLKLHPSLCRRYRVVDTLEEALYLLAHDDDPAFLNT